MLFEVCRLHGKAPWIDRGIGDAVVHDDDRLWPGWTDATAKSFEQSSHSDHTLTRAQRHDHWIRTIQHAEIGGIDLLDGEALQKCGRGEHVAVLLDHHLVRAKHAAEKAP